MSEAFQMTCRVRLFLAALALVTSAPWVQADGLSQAEPVMLRSLDALPAVDRIVVHKAERRMLLLRGDSVVRSYRIALGRNPVGTKERAGDYRTPEGHYFLARRNPRSDYFLSIQVSYPGPQDLRRAHARHWDAGGSIMIHGMPNQLKHEPDYYSTQDWTDGCIAVSNADMVEIWMLAQDNTPIDILP